MQGDKNGQGLFPGVQGIGYLVQICQAYEVKDCGNAAGHQMGVIAGENKGRIKGG